jgi:hypothetical protein
MNKTSYRVIAVVAVALAATAMAYSARQLQLQPGISVPRRIAMHVRGGDAEPVCSWLKSAECSAVSNSSDLSSCPAQTFYYEDGEGSEYAKGDGWDYCGTQREGDPQVYDCACVMIDTAGCAK